MSDGHESSDTTRTPLPSVVVDPLASLTCWDIDITLGAFRYTIPAASALEWLLILLDDDAQGHLDRILPGMLPDDQQDHLEDALIAGLVGVDELHMARLDALAAAAGRSWWFTLGFCAQLRYSWDRLGGMMSALDTRVLSLSAWLDMAWMHTCAAVEPGQLAGYTRQLNTPPPGFGPDPESDEAIQEEEAAFMAAMGM